MLPKTNTEFLRALFGDKWPDMAVSSGKDTWGVKPAGKRLREFLPAASNYFCVSTFTTPYRRGKSLFKEQLILVVDDIGTKIDQDAAEFILPPASYKIETSPGNFQWGYVFKDGVADRRAAEALVDAAIRHELLNPSGIDPGMKAVTRMVRLPFGVNEKETTIAKYGKPTPCRITEWSPHLRYGVDELAAVFHADLSEEALEASDRASLNGTPSEEEVNGDFIMGLFRSRGMIVDESRNDEGFIAVECPWAEMHTDGRTEAGYRPGLGGFKCHHGHCVNKHMPELRAWACEVMTPEERADIAAREFHPLDEDDPLFRAEVERAEKSAKEKEEKFTEATDRYVYVASLERFGDKQKRMLHTIRGFNNIALDIAPAGSSGKKSASAIFLNGAGEIADDIDYMPGKPVVAETEKNGVPFRAFNLWRPGHIEPSEGSVQDDEIFEWLEHVAFILPDPGAYELFLDWCAYQLQNPGRKINWAFVLRGAQGIGKDLMLRPFLEILGLWNVSAIKAKDIEGDWTDYLERQLVLIEELPPFNKKDIYESLKSLVCVAQELVRVNKKNVPQYYIRNTQNYFIFTNHADALALEQDDRRFYVFGSPNTPKDGAYYLWKAAAFRSSTLKAKIFAWLLQRDLSRFNPMASPPMTEAKQEMIAATRPAVDAWVDEQFEDGGKFAGRKLISADEVMTAAKSGGAFGTVPFSVSSRITPKAITAKFKALGGVHLTRFRSSTGTRMNLWALISPELYSQMGREALEKAYLAELKINSSEAA